MQFKHEKIASLIYQVCIPKTFRDFFDYRATNLNPIIGARVWVPFGKKRRLGVVIGVQNISQVPNSKLKTIDEVIDEEPLLPNSILSLCKWVSGYYQSPLSEVITLALPKVYREGKSSELPKEYYYQLKISVEEAHTLLPKHAHRLRDLVDFLHEKQSLLEINARDKNEGASAGCGGNLQEIHDKIVWIDRATLLEQKFTSVQIHNLLNLKIIRMQQNFSLPKVHYPKTNSSIKILNDEQLQAIKAISQYWAAYHAFLLYGVTGSGKTEVYLELIKQVLAQKKQALLLVPEIGLTPQLLARFSSQLTCAVGVIHSSLTENERQLVWQQAKEKQVALIIGTRTAIFTPMPELALIIIDEEHDSSFKQQDGVRYSARDTALVRAQSLNIPIVLGSATPSLESLNNCEQKKYSLLRLNYKALTQNPLHYHLTDLRSTRLKHGLADQTVKTIEKHLNQGNQILVFINRRGFAPTLLCHACGWSARCSACDKTFTFHRSAERLLCHHCNISKKVMTKCAQCQGENLIPLGIGTQRVHEYLAECFPNQEVLRIDRDGVQKKHAFSEALEKIETGKVQLMVGTQMLAKGHHFPRLTLVVILDADAGFYSQDFRALERLGQLITQVSGRAGRAEHLGEVVIQTYLPNHPLLNELIQKGYDPFAKKLLKLREEAQLSPYHFLALIRAQHKQEKKAKDFLEELKAQISPTDLQILGPSLAPMPRKENYYRMQLLLKSASRKKLQYSLKQLKIFLTENQIASNVRWNIDVDPIDLL